MQYNTQQALYAAWRALDLHTNTQDKIGGFDEIKRQAYARRLMSRDHFSVEGTLIEASASLKSFVSKNKPSSEDKPDDPTGRNREVGFKGQRRKNDTGN